MSDGEQKKDGTKYERRIETRKDLEIRKQSRNKKARKNERKIERKEEGKKEITSFTPT